jgi:hypothetical protein
MCLDDDWNVSADKSCRYYVTEAENGEIVYCNDDGGFCLLRDFFTSCNGRCRDYDERNEMPEL